MQSTDTNSMTIGGREFQRSGKTYIMGILNVTPDSFSDGGSWNSPDAALRRVEEMAAEGAHVIDIGGESTRPGYTAVSEQEEIQRTAPVIEAVKARFDIPISLDTSKAKVARAGIAAGADMINDIWGLRSDGEMAGVIAKSGVSCCLMHNRKNAAYRDFMRELKEDLAGSLQIALQAGIEKKHIILDPGVGFAKSYEQNLEAVGRLEELHELGCPLLLGCSRKSVIGITLNADLDERLEGTLATTVIGVMKGCMFVRVHDIKANARAVRMAEAILRGGR